MIPDEFRQKSRNHAAEGLRISEKGGSAEHTPPADDELVRALENVNRRLRRRLYDLSSLFRISIDLTALRQEDALVNAYLLNVAGLLGAEVGVVLLSRSKHQSVLDPALVHGLSDETVRHLIMLLERQERAGSSLLDSTRPQRMTRNGGSGSSGVFREIAESVGIDVVAPLCHRGERLGITLLGKGSRRVPFSNAEIEMLGLLSNLMAVALSNVRMYQRLEQMSQTDGLTGLYNRRHFQTLLHIEISRAKRFGRQVSLALIDIDHFKNYNDTLGHLAGDMLLRRFSRLLQDSVRCTDFVARYGGEEFCVILPEVGREGARSFCERLRKRIASHPFPHGTNQPEGRVTVSIGCSTYPDDASSPEDLVAAADSAMYEAKASGRNRAVHYRPPSDKLLRACSHL